jgi:hypothetical protein
MATTTATRTNPRATKKYKALIAAEFSDSEALNFLASQGVDVSHVQPKDAPEDDALAALVQAGFTREQAEQLNASQPKGKKAKKKAKKAKAAKAAPAPEVLTAKQEGEALVAQRGFSFSRGRVYSTMETIEAQVRVLKTGRPEVVSTSGVGRVVAVLIYREESGDVAVQNLAKPV